VPGIGSPCPLFSELAVLGETSGANGGGKQRGQTGETGGNRETEGNRAGLGKQGRPELRDHWRNRATAKGSEIDEKGAMRDIELMESGRKARWVLC
jgi:hypothetical protein